MDKVLVVGSYNVGLCTIGGAIPKPGETILAKQFFQVHGGKGSNQAIASARLGAPTSFLAKLGDDAFAEAARKLLVEEGFDTSTLLVDSDSPTGVGLVIVDAQGRNAISVGPGANACLSQADIENHAHLFQSARVILTQLETPLETVAAAIRLAQSHGLLVVLDPAPAASLPAGLLAGVSICTPNEHEAEELTGIDTSTMEGATAAGEALRQQGVDTAIVTLGERGSLLVDADGTWHCPPVLVQAVDTSGAGDAFNGALVASLAQGESVQKAMQFATRAASYSVQHLGVLEGLPTLDQLSFPEV